MKASVLLLVFCVVAAAATSLSNLNELAQVQAHSAERARLEALHSEAQLEQARQVQHIHAKGGLSRELDELEADQNKLAALRATVAHAAKLTQETKAKGFWDVMSPEGTDFCWKATKLRGVGKIPTTCDASTQEKIGLLCYSKCDGANQDQLSKNSCKNSEALQSAGFGCRAACPADTESSPLVCFGKGLKFFSGTSRRCGYERWPVAAGCANGASKQAGLCYVSCPSGADPVGPVCWFTCPTGFESCGAGCAKAGKCTGVVMDMVTTPIVAGLKISALVVSAGASAVPGFMSGVATEFSTDMLLGAVADGVSAIASGIKSYAASAEYTEDQKTWSVYQNAGAAMVQTVVAMGAASQGLKICKFIYDCLIADDAIVDVEKLKGKDIARLAVQLAIRVASALDPTGLVKVADAFAWPICKNGAAALPDSGTAPEKAGRQDDVPAKKF